jgi:hypothetical protein
MTGFITRIPGLIVTIMCAAMICLDPMAGIWMLITAVTAAGAFVLGAMRKPPPGVYRHLADTQRITQLRRQLAAEQARADQAQMLIGCLITGPFPPVPSHREPRELGSPRSTPGGHDGRP